MNWLAGSDHWGRSLMTMGTGARHRHLAQTGWQVPHPGGRPLGEMTFR